jgi:hypothetical protein
MRKWRSLGLLVLLAAACSSVQDIAAAEKAVERFRELMSKGQFAQIYAEAGDDFRKGVNEQEFSKFLAAIKRKLGQVKKAERVGWNVNFHTAGTFVTLGFKTEFEKGSGAEQFVFHVKNGVASLVRYNINSPALVIN